MRLLLEIRNKVIGKITLKSSWHRIESFPSPGVAPHQALQTDPSSLDYPVAFNGLHGVMGASGQITARRGYKGRNSSLIQPDCRHHQGLHMMGPAARWEWSLMGSICPVSERNWERRNRSPVACFNSWYVALPVALRAMKMASQPGFTWVSLTASRSLRLTLFLTTAFPTRLLTKKPKRLRSSPLDRKRITKKRLAALRPSR